jgi:hypothetical protein
MKSEVPTHDDVAVLNEEPPELKRCPFCAEPIQALAIKCRYCGEFLDGSGVRSRKARPKKWYFATGTVVIALLCLGPLGLPLVWLNPRYKPMAKVIVTAIVLGLTVACGYLLQAVYQQFLDQLSALGL